MPDDLEGTVLKKNWIGSYMGLSKRNQFWILKIMCAWKGTSVC